ncbi:MAG: hypothetical protein J5861_06465, partial [Desulfovibrio sp.]|nr:hypothetical protein [Desulfovibrio sp.]
VYKASVLAVLAVLLVGFAAFWLTRDDDTRLRWQEEAANLIDNATEGTVLTGAGDILRKKAPPPPPSVVNPATLPGTLAGQSIQGSVQGARDNDSVKHASTTGVNDVSETGSTTKENVNESHPAAQALTVPRDMPLVVPRVTEDSRVRSNVVEDLATWLVSRYKRGQHGGTLNVSVQSLNQRYGVKLAATSTEGRGGGRDALMRYAFQPTMLRGLYGLYAERFLEAIDREASSRGFTTEQSRQLRKTLAGRMVLLASALDSVASLSDLQTRLSSIDKAAQNVVEVNAQMADAVFDLDQLRESKASTSQLSAASLRVEGLTARYRRSLDSQTKAERALVAAVRQSGGMSLDDDTLLFLAQWVGRRVKKDNQALESVRASAEILRDLAQRSVDSEVTKAQEKHPSLQGNNGSPQSAQNLAHQTQSPLPSGNDASHSPMPLTREKTSAVPADSVPEPQSVPALPAPPTATTGVIR